MRRSLVRLMVSLVFTCTVSLFTAGAACAVHQSGFLIAVSLVPGNWVVDRETDLARIAEIADTISVAAGRYKSFQEKKLAPTLDAAHRQGLKVILCYYRIKDGNTSLEELAAKYGGHPAVIGFKLQDELGSNGESPEKLLAFLKEAKSAIRKHTDKPIMFDVIPWEFWMAGTKSYRSYQEKYPGSSNRAIDAYIEAGVVDWLIVSVSERATSISAVLPRVIERWGDRVPVLLRTSASFRGDRYTKNSGSDPVKARERIRTAYDAGARGIYFYTWQHAGYRLMNKDGSSNPLYEGMRDTFGRMSGKQRQRDPQ